MTTNNEDDINNLHDAPAGTLGEQWSKSNDIKSTRVGVMVTADDKYIVTEPATATHSQYPYNKVEQSLSGHVKEIDDTPGAERLMEMHKSGTFVEIHPDGSRVTKIFGEDFMVILDDHNLFVGGSLNITVDGNVNMMVKGNLKTKVSGNLETIVHGDMTTRVTGKTTLYSKDDIDFQTSGNIYNRSDKEIKLQSEKDFSIKSGGTSKLKSKGRTYIDGSRIDFNLPGSIPKNIKRKDIGPGLEFPDSLIEPSKDIMLAIRTDNSAVISSVNPVKKKPKDRKKFDDIKKV